MIETASREPWSLGHAPRPWQIAALDKWWMSGQRGIAEVVTGAGKTFFAEMCMARFIDRHPSGRVVILVPSLALLDQWFVSLVEDLSVPPGEIAFFSGETRTQRPRRVNLMTLNTAREKANAVAGSAPTLLIADECHRAASPANARALSGEQVASLGISATPRREYDDAFQTVLLPSLGPVIFTYDYNQARRDGVIAPFRLVNVKFELQPKEREVYERLTKRVARLMQDRRRGEPVEGQLENLLRKRARVSNNAVLRVPATVHLLEAHRGQRSIVFHEQIDPAERIYQLLLKKKHRATLYHSKIGPNIRRDNLRLYRRGVFDGLVTCRALDEGADIPEATVAIIASATASSRQRIQRLGRVLRPVEGKTMATIYTLYATDPEERRLLEEAETLEGAEDIDWRRIRMSGDG